MALNRELIESRFQDIRWSLERLEQVRALSREAFLELVHAISRLLRPYRVVDAMGEPLEGPVRAEQTGPRVPHGNVPDLSVLKQVFQRYDEIAAVYLFGSHAAGRARRESDLDLAILPRRRGALRNRRVDILADLACHGFCEVDLVFLDTDDIVLKYEAVRHNRLVYQAEDFDRGAFYSKVVRQYLDFLPYLDVQRRAYKKRILNGQS